MACPVVPLRTQLLYYAQEGGEWTYNGFSTTFDGDRDNLVQFNDTPTSEPEEFGDPLVGDDPTVDPTGHDVGFYSLTYTITDGGCEVENNIVLPIMETYYAGVDVVKSSCPEDQSTYNLYTLVSEFEAPSTVDDQGYWVQLNGTPNPHPGFFDGDGDPTLATFDPTFINYPSDGFPLEFYYTTQEPNLTGFDRTRCAGCAADHSLVRFTFYTVSDEGGCCPDQLNCYTLVVPDGTAIYSFNKTVGSLSDADLGMDFPYTLPGDLTGLLNDVQEYLSHNGGGTISAVDTGVTTTITITAPCVGFTQACTADPCSTNIAITESACL
jgi:hypothetical protein